MGKRGRPPGGVRGARVRDYPGLVVRLPPATRQLLGAVSRAKGMSASALMIEMISVYHHDYLSRLDRNTYSRVEEILASEPLVVDDSMNALNRPDSDPSPSRD